MAFGFIPNWLKYLVLAVLVLITVGDSLIDTFWETTCHQDGKEVSVVSGYVTCEAVAGLRFTWSEWHVYTWKTTYEGEMLINRMNGLGKYVSPSGSSYQGNFLEDEREGLGTFSTKDGSTTWSGNWDHDHLTGSANTLRTNRSDIFKKIVSLGPHPIQEAVYNGQTNDGLLSGPGTIEFYTLTPKRSLIFSIEGNFERGNLKQPFGEIPIEWGAASYRLLRSTSVTLRNWHSRREYRDQDTAGYLVLNETQSFSWIDGTRQPIHQIKGKEDVSVISNDWNELSERFPALEGIKQAIEAIRVFEWHFLYHRMVLDPIVPLLEPPVTSNTFEGPVASKKEYKSEL